MYYDQTPYWPPRGDKKLTSSSFNFNFSTPERKETSNPSPYFHLSSPRLSSATTFPLAPAGLSNSSSGQLDVSTPGQVQMGGARRRPDKSVTFNNEDLFNIYERDNSTSFGLCSPLATNSPINPPAASSPHPLTPITAPTPPCPPLPATPLSLMCSRSLAVASLHQYPEARAHPHLLEFRIFTVPPFWIQTLPASCPPSARG